MMQLSARRSASASVGLRSRAAGQPCLASHILIADDDEFSSNILARLLERRGYQVSRVNNGTDAIELSRSRPFVLMLLDLHLPDINGILVVREIRRHQVNASSHLPIVVLTASSRRNDRDDCNAAGADDFLSKPLCFEELWIAINRAVPEPQLDGQRSGLLDMRPPTLANGKDLRHHMELCDAGRRLLPDRMANVRRIFATQDSSRLREAAHQLSGMISLFSAKAASVASDLETCADAGQLTTAHFLVERLDRMVAELVGSLGIR